MAIIVEQEVINLRMLLS